VLVLLSETTVGLFEQDYHFGPGGKLLPGWANYVKNLLSRPGILLANASGRVDFSKPDQNHFNNFGIKGPGIILVEFGQIAISGSEEIFLK